MRKIIAALSIGLILSTVPVIEYSDAGRLGLGRILKVPRLIRKVPRAIIRVPLVASHILRRSVGRVAFVIVGASIFSSLHERDRVHVAKLTEETVERDPDQEVTEDWESEKGDKKVTIKASPQKPAEYFLVDPDVKAAAQRDLDKKRTGSLELADASADGGPSPGDETEKAIEKLSEGVTGIEEKASHTPKPVEQADKTEKPGDADTKKKIEKLAEKADKSDLSVLLAEVPADTPCRRVESELTVKTGKKAEAQQSEKNTTIVCRTLAGKWEPAVTLAAATVGDDKDKK